MKYQVLFSLKNNEKDFINVVAVVIGALRVNPLYTGGHIYRNMFDVSTCPFRGIGSILSLLFFFFFFDKKPASKQFRPGSDATSCGV